MHLLKTEDSVSTNKALGTYVSVCVMENIAVEFVVNWLTVPSELIPCSRQNNSQHADPSWTPACPTCIHINWPCDGGGGGGGGGGSTGTALFLFGDFLDLLLRLFFPLFFSLLGDFCPLAF